MSRLAPGRVNDMNMLMQRRAKYKLNTPMYDKIQQKIEDLIEEGKDEKLCRMRYRLVMAARAEDDKAIENISEEIRDYVRRTNPYRFRRGWVKG